MKNKFIIPILILIVFNMILISSCNITASKTAFITMTPTLMSSAEQTYAEKTSPEITNPNATAVKDTDPSEYAEFSGDNQSDVPTFPTFTPIANTNLESTTTPLAVIGTIAPQTTSAPPAVPTTIPPQVTQDIAHTVAYGESLWCLARRYNVDPTALMNVNGMNNSSWLTIGQTVTIPSGVSIFGGQRSLQAHPTNYTIQYGDTLAVVACLFGDLYPSQIATANGQPESWAPTAGTIISIP